MTDGWIRFKAKLPRYAVRDGRHLYVSLPETSVSVLGLKADTRTNPLYLSSRGIKHVSVRVEAPAGFEVRYLPDRLWSSWSAAGDGYEPEVGVKKADYEVGLLAFVFPHRSRVEVVHVCRFAPAIVEPGRYRELLELDQALSRPRNCIVILEKVDEPAAEK